MSTSTVEQAWDLYDRGCDQFQRQEFAEAAASFEAAAAILSHERSPWFNLGIACLHQGDHVGGFHIDGGDLRVVSPNDAWYVRSIAAFTRVLQIEPGHTPALVMRGHAHRKRLDDDLARADWTAAQQLGDPHAGPLLARL